MANRDFTSRTMETDRHRTRWIEFGPQDGPLMIFIHGWPELGLVWKAQLAYFGSKGWRCIAPDMRGYGGSSVPTLTAAYSVRELVADMVELLDALGGQPAIWIGHDWGSAVAWSMASHHPERCRGVANMCIPYFARGLALPNLIPLVDRGLYPRDKYPVGQWDYWLFYQEHFQRASEDFEADVEATLKLLYRSAPSAPPTGPSFSASIRESGGWFGPARRAPSLARDERMLEQVDFDALVIAFRSTGFKGANAWYLNEAANLAFAAEAANFGRLTLPVLFLHATRDGVCDTFRGRLAEPMREDCQALTEVAIDAGHELMLERPQPVNEALFSWLKTLSH